MRVYYNDGHSEIVFDDIKTYLHQNKGKQGYKKAIYVHENWLYPTMNQKDEYCHWINLQYLLENDSYYKELLKEKSLYHKAKMMYLKQTSKEIEHHETL